MKNLGIKSLNIISDQEATIDSNELRTIKILLNKEETSTAPESSSISSLTTSTAYLSIRPILFTLAIKMAKNLHELLLYIDNLPTIPPTMNPININIKLYIQKLLEKISILTKEQFKAEIENQNNQDFLIIYNLKNVEQEDIKQEKEQEEKKEIIDFQSKLNFSEIISEIDLLKFDSNFDIIKENIIKTLVNHLIKVYDRLLEEHIETEIRRRRKFRGYINFLIIY